MIDFCNDVVVASQGEETWARTWCMCSTETIRGRISRVGILEGWGHSNPSETKNKN